MTLKEHALQISSKVERLKNKPLFMKAEGAEVILAEMANLLHGLVDHVNLHEMELNHMFETGISNRGENNG